jgi:hypothetical protein
MALDKDALIAAAQLLQYEFYRREYARRIAIEYFNRLEEKAVKRGLDRLGAARFLADYAEQASKVIRAITYKTTYTRIDSELVGVYETAWLTIHDATEPVRRNRGKTKT